MSSGPVQRRRRSLPEGMLSHTCPTYAVTLCTCEDFSEDAVVKPPPQHFNIGVISNTVNVSINLNPYLQLDVGFVGVTLQWASGALSNCSIIATTNTFTSQLVTDMGWRDCLQALTHNLSVSVRVPLGFQVNLSDLSQG